jgi:hypothetical protein
VIEAQAAPAAHPVRFDVAYPLRLSRGRTLLRLPLAVPHLIVLYLLEAVASLLALFSWFALLFTGRFPASMFEFVSGVLRWQLNVLAYLELMRDEYPPFSFEAGEYPLRFDVPRAARQSRLRLFTRWIAVLPNYVVLQFVLLASVLTGFIAWWAILFSGRYPRGLFKFNVGALRWFARTTSYALMLRDEYPPYSLKQEAAPGWEWPSFGAGIVLFGAYVATIAVIALAANHGPTATVERAWLAKPSALAAVQPTAEHHGLPLTLFAYRAAGAGPAPAPVGDEWVETTLFAEAAGAREVEFEPALVRLVGCDGTRYEPWDADRRGAVSLAPHAGRTPQDIAFIVPADAEMCALEYRRSGLLGPRITFKFE